MRDLNPKTVSLLEALTQTKVQSSDDPVYSVESRASHIVSSMITLLESIQDDFTDEEIEYIQNKMFSAVRNRQEQRFIRSMNKIKESRRHE